MSEFSCCKCKNTYLKKNNKKWNEFKAAEEFIDLYPECKNDATFILCEDCNEEFKKWLLMLTDEEKKKMREEYELDKRHWMPLPETLNE